MNWKAEYKRKVSRAEQAIKDIHDGDCVVLGHAAAVPKIVPQAMADHCEDYNDVLIFHMTTLGDNPLLHPRCFGHFRHVSNFLSGNSRDAVSHLNADFFPAYFHDVPEMIGDEIPCDVAVFQATPPNEEGYCSLGVSCDYALAATITPLAKPSSVFCSRSGISFLMKKTNIDPSMVPTKGSSIPIITADIF